MSNTRGMLASWAVVIVVSLGLTACGSGDDDDDGAAGKDAADAGTSAGSGAGEAGSAAGSGAGEQVEPSNGCKLSGMTREQLAGMLEPIGGVTSAREPLMTAMGLHWVAYHTIQRLGDDGVSAVDVLEASGVDVLASNQTTLAFVGAFDSMQGIWTLPLGASAPTPKFVAETSSFIEAMALDETHAYVGGSASDGLVRADLTSGAATEIANPFGVQAVQVDGGYVYYVEKLEEVVARVPVAGGEPEIVTPKVGLIGSMLMDESAIYLSTNYSLDKVARSDQQLENLMRHKTAKSSITNSLADLLDAGDRLLFADRLDNIGWVMKDGSGCGYVATTTNTESPAVYHTHIALDAEYLYVFDEQVPFRIARSAVGLE